MVDRNQWKQFQNIMMDSAKFVDMLFAIEWEEGLPVETIQGKKKYNSQNRIKLKCALNY